MRFLHVSEVHAGGVLSLLRVYTAEQQRRGHEVHLLAPDPMDLNVHDYHRWGIDRGSPWTYPAALATLRKVVRRTQPDVVHLHSFFAGLLGRVLPGRLPGTPAVLYQPHSWAFNAVPHEILSAAVVGSERWAARRTDVVAGNCLEEIEEGRRHRVKVPTEILGIAVDTSYFSPPSPSERQDLRTRLELGSHKVALCVGRLTHQKAQDRLVAAWERNPVLDTVLLLVGSGDDTALRALAPREWGRSIRAVGHQEDVRSWLRAADLLIQSSRYEGQSVAVAEALSCGLPAMTLDVNGAHAAVTAGPLPPAGAVVAQGDIDALLDQCRMRTSDQQKLAQESRAARVRAESLFCVDTMMDRLDAAYEHASRNAGEQRRGQSE
ncbi:MAG: glycosyltransferase [Nocardioidaceae bacterium]|nr:glycosyltransferase [Nocardioidaceae bacterium]